MIQGLNRNDLHFQQLYSTRPLCDYCCNKNPGFFCPGQVSYLRKCVFRTNFCRMTPEFLITPEFYTLLAEFLSLIIVGLTGRVTYYYTIPGKSYGIPFETSGITNKKNGRKSRKNIWQKKSYKNKNKAVVQRCPSGSFRGEKKRTKTTDGKPDRKTGGKKQDENTARKTHRKLAEQLTTRTYYMQPHRPHDPKRAFCCEKG